MKNWFIGIFVVAVLLTMSILIYLKNSQMVIPESTPTPASTIFSSPTITTSFCDPTQLQGLIETEGGAGNIYGTITIKNTSNSECQIIGNNNLQASFDQTIKNIKLNYQAQSALQTFTLTANQTIYSQIHFPNGPQCSSAPKQVPVTISYKISPTDPLTFKTANGNPLQVPHCTDPNELTTLDLWPLSDKPVTQ